MSKLNELSPGRKLQMSAAMMDSKCQITLCRQKATRHHVLSDQHVSLSVSIGVGRC